MTIINNTNKIAVASSLLAICVLGFIVYANSLNGQFVWDDSLLIKHNKYIQDWKYVPKLFTASTGEGAESPNAYYRPIELLTYMFDYSLWKLSVRGYHLTNILLHIIMSLSVFWLIHVLFKDILLSLVTSMLYGVHPIHVEAVAYITGRPEIPSAICMVWCVIFYDRFFKHKNRIFYSAALLSCLLAFLSRENSIILPFLLLIWHYVSKNRIRLTALLPFFCITVFYIALRLTIFSFTKNYGIWLHSAPARIPGFFVALFNYLRFLVLPIGLHAAYGPGSITFAWSNPRVVAGILLLILFVFLVWRGKSANRLATFSILWFFIALAPYTNIYPRLPFYMNDHHMYLPSIGFFLLCAHGLCSLYRKKHLRIAASLTILIALLFYAHTTIQQNNYWREPIAFYKKTLSYSPDNAKMYLGLGQTYYEMGSLNKAIASYEKAIELEPTDAKAYYNIGVIYRQKGNHVQAIDSFTQAIEYSPHFAKALNNLGVIYLATEKYDQAIALFHRTLQYAPDFAEAWNNLGVTYARSDKYEQAIVFFEKAVAIDPDYADAHNNAETAKYYIGLKASTKE